MPEATSPDAKAVVAVSLVRCGSAMIDDNIHDRAVFDGVSREFVEIGGENTNVLWDDGIRREIRLLRSKRGERRSSVHVWFVRQEEWGIV